VSDAWFPDGARSRILLIGTAGYRHRKNLRPIPSVHNNLLDLRKTFTDPDHGILAGQPEHCTVLGADGTAVDQETIGKALSTASDQAEDLLLVYYAGHGLLDDDGLLYLTLKHTDPKQLEFTAVDLNLLKRRLARARARARVLILDCCFSGRAIEAMGPLPSLVSGQLPASGTYTLTSTSATRPSHAPPKDRNTSFTGALLAALGEPEPMRLDEIYQHVKHQLDDRGLTAPQCRAVGDTGRIALARGAVPVPPPQTRPPRHRLPATLLWVSGAVGTAVTAAAIGIPIAQQAAGEAHEKKSTPTAEPTPSTTAPISTLPSKSTPTSPRSSPGGSSASDSQRLEVAVRQTKHTADGTVTIGVTSAVGQINDASGTTIFGNGGETGGGGSVTADGAPGSSTVGFADFYIETPVRTCKARGVAIGESTVVAESSGVSGKWARITVVAVEDAISDPGNTAVTFQVTRGKGAVPKDTAACA
jgi:hypothetical protein